MKKLPALFLGCFLAVSSFSVFAAEERPPILSQEEEARLQKQFEVLAEIVAYISLYALDRPQDIASCVTEMIAMRRLDKCLDKFSYYLPLEEVEEFKIDTTGEFGGIGLELIQKDGLVVVMAPLDGTPAARAGFKPEDIILKVDNKEVESLKQAVRLIRGPEGSKVEIEIFRKGSAKPIKIVVTREKILVHPVKSRDVVANGKKAGVIKVNSFSEKTSREFQHALYTFKKQGVKNIVIDLRNNPGGLMHGALEMLALFIKPGDLALTYRTREEELFYNYNFLCDRRRLDCGKFRDLRVVILINKGSASASEIFAGAMKDWGYPVVGEKSFGKGVGQTLHTLSDGSKFALTTFEFLVGNNRTPIRDKGVFPNYEVQNSDNPENDLQMEKALEILSQQ